MSQYTSDSFCGYIIRHIIGGRRRLHQDDTMFLGCIPDTLETGADAVGVGRFLDDVCHNDFVVFLLVGWFLTDRVRIPGSI